MWSLFIADIPEVLCEVKGQEGYVQITVNHNFEDMKADTYGTTRQSFISYDGFPTHDILQDLMMKSFQCEQNLTLPCSSSWNTTMWRSLYDSKWHPQMFETKLHKWVIL